MASKPEGRLIRHDVPGHITARMQGQHDCINKLSCNPDRYGLGDEYRRNLYNEGYAQEETDLLTAINL